MTNLSDGTEEFERVIKTEAWTDTFKAEKILISER
jgi:hypothetical protein